MESSNSPSDSHNDDDFDAARGAKGRNHGTAPSSTSSHKLNVRKDRACPFCKQVFTSSSLGRHLDFFIRDKRPKLPDGVHDVDKIRQLRGTITRRHARISGAKKEHLPEDRSTSTPARSEGIVEATMAHEESKIPSVAEVQHAQQPLPSSHASPRPRVPIAQPPPPAPQSIEQLPVVRSEPPTMASWTATGVINGLGTGSARFPRILPRPDQQHPRAVGQDGDEYDNAHAAELALREVLDTIKRAAARDTQIPIFDFDFLSMSFPALCLHLLEVPSTLFSASPMHDSTRIPLSTTPGNQQFEAAHNVLMDRLRSVQLQQSTQQGQTSMTRYVLHLDEAFKHWSGEASSQQQVLWKLELLRALAYERSAKSTAERKLDELQGQVESLKTQLELIRTQQPSWMQAPPLASPGLGQHRDTNASTLQMSNRATRGLKQSGFDLHDWDYERLISKWKPVAQNERTRRQWQGPPPRVNPDGHVITPNRPISAAPSHEMPRMVMYTPPQLQSQQIYRQQPQVLSNSHTPRTDRDDRDGEHEDDPREDVDMLNGNDGQQQYRQSHFVRNNPG
jgi:hypothetical protein